MGCSFGTERQSKIIVPEATLKKCPERTLATQGDFPHLFQNHRQLIADYEVCKLIHNELVEDIKRQNRL